jgi:two-component system response regulator MprA
MTKRILIVEDEADVAQTFADVLEGAGYHTLRASNGLEGLEHLRTGGRPSLILLDVSMPVLDGWGFRREQQLMPGGTTVPVMVITADSDAGRKAAALGAQGWLRKPCGVRALLDEVYRLCGPPEGEAPGMRRAAGA